MFPNFKGNDWHVFVFTASDFTGELVDSLERWHLATWITEETFLVGACVIV
jgi:hypothetical protein